MNKLDLHSTGPMGLAGAPGDPGLDGLPGRKGMKFQEIALNFLQIRWVEIRHIFLLFCEKERYIYFIHEFHLSQWIFYMNMGVRRMIFFSDQYLRSIFMGENSPVKKNRTLYWSEKKNHPAVNCKLGFNIFRLRKIHKYISISTKW